MENGPIKIKKINTTPLATCSAHLGEDEDENEVPPPRPVRVPKPYEEWTKEDHILSTLDNDAKNEIMKMLDKIIFGKVKDHITTAKQF